ncbi:MAG: methylenetetrahydrofolate reductase [Anaerolineae bacterium]|nr:methylenetetrahydrofolate reductase [Anaerolineae bacterium]
MKVGSNLEKVLSSGHFAVTGELGPPQSADAGVIQHKAGLLKGYVDAVNITDCQTAVVRMSSISAAVMLLNLGIEPTIQMTCRDRNRIAIQSDLLGAAALGIKNLLCLTGDHQIFGNHPQSRNVFDINSMQLLRMVKDMRDEKKFQCGDEMKGPEPRFFIGAAANPFADPFEYRPYRLAKKVRCGADFIQTQIVFNVPKFREYMKRVVDLGVHEQCYILAGVAPIKSYGAARYMATKVPGMDVPDEIVQRMKATPKEKQAEEGIKVCIEIIQQVREIPGVAGVHIMAIEWEESVAEITAQAGLLPRPVV